MFVMHGLLLHRRGAEVSAENRNELDRVSGAVVDSAIKVHTRLGPGLLEAPYRRCLAHELRARGHSVVEELSLAVTYEGLRIPNAYKLDLVVDRCVIVEVKAVIQVLPVHHAQVLTYLRLSDTRVGLLIDFYVAHMKDGIRRLVNNY